MAGKGGTEDEDEDETLVDLAELSGAGQPCDDLCPCLPSHEHVPCPASLSS